MQKIVKDLQQAGYIEVRKQGRCNRYRINRRKSLRHPLEAHCSVSKLVNLVAPGARAAAMPALPDTEAAPAPEPEPGSSRAAGFKDASPGLAAPRPAAVDEAAAEEIATEEISKEEISTEEIAAEEAVAEEAVAEEAADDEASSGRSAKRRKRKEKPEDERQPIDIRQQGSLF
ncbi:MAG: hypothetical protein P8Y54_11455 [Xanthomonadales bacterium]